jgi:precorrin-2 dehydrogenase / sirohydrochlorin ferrochelatase
MRAPPVTAANAAHRTRPAQYPVNFDLVDVPCLVVGGGEVAARKIAGLLDCGAAVTVVAPDAIPRLRDDPRLRWHRREYRRGEVASYRLAVTATGIPAVDGQVARDARAAGVPVNAADDPANCTFTLPAVVRQGDVQITVSTGGRSPALAAWLRTRIEAALDESVTELLDLLAATRDALRHAGIATEIPGWRRALEAGLADLVRQGRLDEARALLHAELGADLGIDLDVALDLQGARP